MRLYIFTLFILLFPAAAFAQMTDSCQLVGTFALQKLEMSQQLDSNSRSIPPIRWSLYEQSGLFDTLSIKEGFGFTRIMNFKSHYQRILTGQFKVKQDSSLTLFIAKGQLYTMPDLAVESLNRYELVIVEKFKTRWIRRSFRSNVPIRP